MATDVQQPEVTQEEIESRTHASIKKLADFIALFEEAAEKIEKHETATSEQLQKREAAFEKKLEDIHSAIDELSNFMTQSGVARFRVTAEKLIQENQSYLAEVQNHLKNFETLAANSCDNLQRAAENSASWIAEAIKTLRLDQVRKLTFDHEARIEAASSRAIEKINKIAKWFHWEKISMALIISVMVALLTGLFINDESPWESHSKVVAERDAGKVLLRAWTKLSPDEKNHIESEGAGYL